MSTNTHKSIPNEALSPYTRDRDNYGPANITSTTITFEQKLRGVLGRLNAQIRDAIITRDILNLRNEALVDEPPERVFQTNNTRRARLGFLFWLQTQLERNYLTVVGPDQNQYIRAAYIQGLQHANRELDSLDISFRVEDPSGLTDRFIHRSALQQLYTRTYSNLESVSEDTVDAVRDELLEGFTEGKSPTAIADAITGRVNSIGKHRSTLIARSEIMDAHSTATLNRFKEANERATEGSIGAIHSEWMTAKDSRVCEICRAIDGSVFRIGEMEDGTFELGGTTYQLKPPAHPNGRCVLLPTLIKDEESLPPLSERLPSDTA